MQDQKLQKKILQTEKAIKRFSEIMAKNVTENDYLIDAAIQRFEFCFELIWKTLKQILAKDGIETSSPRDVLRKAFQYKYIDNLELWVNIIDFRNLTSHTYDEILAEEVYEELPKYVALFQELIIKLKQEIS